MEDAMGDGNRFNLRVFAYILRALFTEACPSTFNIRQDNRLPNSAIRPQLPRHHGFELGRSG